MLSVGNHPGSLLAVLAEFASRGINLTRLESRPARSTIGVYVFLVDADGHLDDPAMADVLAALIRRSALLAVARVLSAGRRAPTIRPPISPPRRPT